MNIESKKWFYILITVILITDLAILLNIPFLRHILGFFFLTILPGLLILQILKLNKIGYTEKFVLSVGISISFLMFFGLLINNLSLSLGYLTPLSTISILISFNIAFIILAILGYKTNKNTTFSFTNFELTKSEKAFLTVPILFPALSILGTHLMNTTDNNILSMFLLFSIPIYVVFLCLFNHKFSKRLYPVVIFFISISLLLLLSLRSNHIIGTDTHSEYYIFRCTLDNLHWSVFRHTTLDACLAISLLPTIYKSILNISPEFLFKILFPSLCSISPLVIYLLSKRYVGEFYGFLASYFFMFQSTFLWATAHSRTFVAILFFALAMVTLFNDKVDPLKKRILFIVFMASCMVSHYSTAYIFFFIMLGTFVGIEIVSKKHSFKKVVSLTIVLLFFALIFFWYSQVTEAAFNTGVGFVEETLTNLNKFFIAESRREVFTQLVGQELEDPILSRINFILTWSTFILIGIGVLTMLKRYKEMVAIAGVKRKKPGFLKTKFEMEYLTMALMCAGLLVIMVALPYISIGYDLKRLYSFVIVILSVCFIIGGMILSKHFFFFTKHFLSKKRFVLKEKQKSLSKNTSKDRAYLIILLILIPYSIFATGAIHQLFGIQGSIILNSEGRGYDDYYVYDQESYGARWLRDNGELKNTMIYTTHTGGVRLRSQAGIWRYNPYSLLEEDRKINGYIYLRYYNIGGKILDIQGEEHNMTECQDKFVGKNKIYNNGGSEVWK